MLTTLRISFLQLENAHFLFCSKEIKFQFVTHGETTTPAMSAIWNVSVPNCLFHGPGRLFSCMYKTNHPGQAKRLRLHVQHLYRLLEEFSNIFADLLSESLSSVGSLDLFALSCDRDPDNSEGTSREAGIAWSRTQLRGLCRGGVWRHRLLLGET